uniref:Uncharacterized protein n=1 Tax=Caenorhabditis japonica TaxID=281687 RepID=A0A8R1HT99_CAEJA
MPSSNYSSPYMLDNSIRNVIHITDNGHHGKTRDMHSTRRQDTGSHPEVKRIIGKMKQLIRSVKDAENKIKNRGLDANETMMDGTVNNFEKLRRLNFCQSQINGEMCKIHEETRAFQGERESYDRLPSRVVLDFCTLKAKCAERGINVHEAEQDMTRTTTYAYAILAETTTAIRNTQEKMEQGHLEMVDIIRYIKNELEGTNEKIAKQNEKIEALTQMVEEQNGNLEAIRYYQAAGASVGDKINVPQPNAMSKPPQRNVPGPSHGRHASRRDSSRDRGRHRRESSRDSRRDIRRH